MRKKRRENFLRASRKSQIYVNTDLTLLYPVFLFFYIFFSPLPSFSNRTAAAQRIEFVLYINVYQQLGLFYSLHPNKQTYKDTKFEVIERTFENSLLN
jgi:hypothetical protein